MAESKKYYWLKLKITFFTEKRIKKLRKIAGGNTYTIIYLKMQLLSLQDEGNLYFEGIEDTFEEEIALQIDEEVEDVRMTITYLLNTGLMNKKDNFIYELVETKNCIGSETAGAERVRRFREKENTLKNKEKSEKMLQCNANVTKCNTEIELEKEKELEIELDIEPNPTQYSEVKR